MNTVVYITNRLPQPRLGFLSPFERLKNVMPIVNYFRVFGCVLCVIVDEHRKHMSHDVVFDEASSWWANKMVLPYTQELQEKLHNKLQLDSSQDGSNEAESEEPKTPIDAQSQDPEIQSELRSS
ncbi:hypothetical protein LIER_03388 [Lithospermum erythrorhizon]|uniref:Uncharacterized protein n=1 Tax=Lithospermum erythrorhizon TaxID=34254 RepID=A0AAV3NUG9_LITER